MQSPGKLSWKERVMKRNILLFAFIIMVIGISVCAEELRLPSVIGDHMVIQQQSKVPLWGWAPAGEKVAVHGSWMKSPISDKADSEGRWKVDIKTPKAGGPYIILIKCGSAVRTLEDVMSGEVWLCTGQSNMEWMMSRFPDAKEDIPKAKDNKLRLFTVPRCRSEEPKDDCEGNWSLCTPEVVESFSAVGYYYGAALRKNLNVPVGLLNCSYGGSTAEAWMDWEALSKNPDFAPIIKRAKDQFAFEVNPDEMMKQYEKKVEQSKSSPNLPIPEKPSKPNHKTATTLYNGMLHPILSYGVKGAIWYQGESNVSRAYQYRKLFPALIHQWRKDWKQGKFPFYFVQIAPYQYKGQPETNAAELREAQMMALEIPNTGMAVTMDIGDPTNIHPWHKEVVGERLALWAMAKSYGQKGIVYSGPLYRKIKIEGNKIRLYFDHVGSGLMAKDGPLTHFQIAGKDRQFVPAEAIIDGDTVLVSAPNLFQPVAVRYGWSDAAEPNLFNKEGLPASSFRTDDWPGATFRSR